MCCDCLDRRLVRLARPIPRGRGRGGRFGCRAPLPPGSRSAGGGPGHSSPGGGGAGGGLRAVVVGGALDSFLWVIGGVSGTTFGVARDHYLPQHLPAVHPGFKTRYRAELGVGFVVAVLAGTADVRGAIGFSSFAVLVYY